MIHLACFYHKRMMNLQKNMKEQVNEHAVAPVESGFPGINRMGPTAAAPSSPLLRHLVPVAGGVITYQFLKRQQTISADLAFGVSSVRKPKVTEARDFVVRIKQMLYFGSPCFVVYRKERRRRGWRAQRRKRGCIRARLTISIAFPIRLSRLVSIRFTSFTSRSQTARFSLSFTVVMSCSCFFCVCYQLKTLLLQQYLMVRTSTYTVNLKSDQLLIYPLANLILYCLNSRLRARLVTSIFSTKL